MDGANSFIPTAVFMKGHLWMECQMDAADLSCRMEIIMKEILNLEERMEMDIL